MKTALSVLVLILIFASSVAAIEVNEGAAACLTDTVISVVRLTTNGARATADADIIERATHLVGEDTDLDSAPQMVWATTFFLNQADGVVWFIDIYATATSDAFAVMRLDNNATDIVPCGVWMLPGEQIAPLWDSFIPDNRENEA